MRSARVSILLYSSNLPNHSFYVDLMSPASANDDVSTSETSLYGSVEAGIVYPTLCIRGPQHLSKDDECQPLLGQPIRLKSRRASLAKPVMTIVCIASTAGISSFLNGQVIIALPMMAKDLGLDVDLMLWFVPAIPV